MNYNTTLRFSILIAAAATISSCGSSSDADALGDSDSTANVSAEKDTKAQNVFYSIPSPIETINDLSKAGMEFKKELLNKPESESNYLTSTKKAMNYGVYGVDLAYLAFEVFLHELGHHYQNQYRTKRKHPQTPAAKESSANRHVRFLSKRQAFRIWHSMQEEA